MSRALVGNSAIAARALMAAAMGLQFGGERDVFAAAGYDRVILPEAYAETWRRGDIAKRIVNIFPDETWRLAPVLWDGEETLASNPQNEFLATWQQLAQGGQMVESGETLPGLLAELHRLDRHVGLGRYGVLLFGLRDGRRLEDPVEPGSVQGPGDLLYVESYPEIYAKILEVDSNPLSPRYSKPVRYQITINGGNEMATTQTVHWTRVLHVAEDDGRVYGLPRLEAVWNILTDKLKIMAATGEAAWRLMQPGYVLETQEGYEAPDKDSPEWEDFRTMIDEFTHNLRRWLNAQGMKVNELSGELQDPGPAMEWNIKLISAATGIPSRLLLGSERGELASSQDDDNWADVIQTRQNNHVWPRILLPAINKLRWYGVLPAPKGLVMAKWPALVKRNAVQVNNAADLAAGALQKAGIQAEPEAFVKAYLPDLDPSKVTVATSPPNPLSPGERGNPVANVAGEVMAPTGATFRLADPWAEYP